MASQCSCIILWSERHSPNVVCNNCKNIYLNQNEKDLPFCNTMNHQDETNAGCSLCIAYHKLSELLETFQKCRDGLCTASIEEDADVRINSYLDIDGYNKLVNDELNDIEWIAHIDQEKRTLYFVHIHTKQKTLLKPDVFMNTKKSWIARKDTSGFYYEHVFTQETQWKTPPCFQENKC
eukprot:427978_1